MKILITGCAGFIGFHLCRKFLNNNFLVIGVDNINKSNDYKLKQSRMNLLLKFKNFKFSKCDIKSKNKIGELFSRNKFDCVIHLAAQAGVRDSIENPGIFIESNITGFGNIIEHCKNYKIKKFIYASSSSVYGMNSTKPSKEKENCDKPASIYGATKKSNELIAFTYSNIFGLKTIGLRFFTVYGPWGRPDMALFKFTDAIIKGSQIPVYNYGNMKRDFTYIDDVVNAIFKVTNNNFDKKNYQIYNIGSGRQISLKKFITILEEALNIKAKKRLLPMQDGDVKETFSDNKKINAHFSYKAITKLEQGLGEFVKWYKEYYKVK